MTLLKFLRTYKKYLILVGVFLISFYALYLRIRKLAAHELWDDEYYQIRQMTGSFWEMIKGFPKSEFCTYLSGDYYLVYPFFKMFGFNKWGLAIPHVISAILGLYLLYRLGQRFFKSAWGYAIAFVVVCFNATLIEHATEIRTYAVLPTLALGSLYFWLQLFDADFRIPAIRAWGIRIFFAITILFHAYGILIFTLPGFYAWLIASRDGLSFKRLKSALLFVVPSLVMALPVWCLSVFGPHLDAAKFQINTFQYIPNPLTSPVPFLSGVFGNLVGFKPLYFLMLGVVMPFVLPQRDRLRQIIFFFVLIVLPLGLILTMNVLTHYWFIQRLFIWVMPLFALWLGWIWESAIEHIQGFLSKGRSRRVES